MTTIQKRKLKRSLESTKQILLIGSALVIVTVLMALLLGWAMDTSIDNKNKMLCHSAEKSFNQDYLVRCAEYYSTGEIEYMRYL